ELSLNLRRLEADGAVQRDDYRVKTARQRAKVEPIELSNMPSQPISSDRAFIEFRRNRNAETKKVRRALPRQNREQKKLRAELSFRALHPKKVRSAFKPMLWGKPGYRLRPLNGIVTISRFRPLARRRFSTLRPCAVDIRARKPCVRMRCTWLG